MNRWLYNIRGWLAKKIDPVRRFVATQTLASAYDFPSEIGNYRTYAQTYIQEGWIYKCVSLIAETCAMVNADIYERKSHNETEIIPDHPLDVLLEAPHPKISRFELWLHTYSSLELAGNAYWYIEKNSMGTPIHIIPLFSHRVKVIPSASEYIGGYKHFINGEEQTLKPDEVVHFKYWHPLNDYYGLSRIEAASLPAATDLYAQIWNRDFFKNSARPDGIVTSEQPLTPGEAEEAKERWEKTFKGATKSHRIAVLGKGMSYERITIPPKDMEFLRQREFNRDEILSIFGVPYSVLCMQNRYKATAGEEEENFKKYTLKPKLKLIQEKITAELLPMFGETRTRKVFYKYDELASEDEEQQAKRDEIDVKYGILTPDEIRARRYGLPPRIDGRGDIIFPEIGLYSPIPIEQKEKIEKFLKRVKAFNREKWERKLEAFWKDIFLKQKREVLERVNQKKKDLDNWDEEWDNWLLIIFPLMMIDMTGIFQEGIEATKEFGFQTTFSSSSERASEWLRDHVLKDMVYQVQNTTREQIKASIIKGVAEGESIGQISERIDNIFTSKIAYHSELIARTEVSSAYNWGSYLTYQESGVVSKKRWLTARDERVCRVHCIPNEQAGAISLKALFPSGDECPPAHPRCRCTIIPILE